MTTENKPKIDPRQKAESVRRKRLNTAYATVEKAMDQYQAILDKGRQMPSGKGKLTTSEENALLEKIAMLAKVLLKKIN